MADPVVTVVVVSYNSRGRIDTTLRSLRAQDLDEPFEIVVVDSGSDDAAGYVRGVYPDVRIVRSERRLWPGAARNRGVDAARGRYIVFAPDDAVLRPDYLRRRLVKHRQGFDAVGGSIANSTPRHPVGLAEYCLEYYRILPDRDVLAAQRVPHALSFERGVFDRVGPFPEDVETGEDTLLAERCVAAGVSIGLEPAAQLAPRNSTRLRPFLRHEFRHGRGLMQCIARHGFESGVSPVGRRPADAAYLLFLRYPLARWWASLRFLARTRPGWLPRVVAVSPLVIAGAAATAAGVWHEWRSPSPPYPSEVR